MIMKPLALAAALTLAPALPVLLGLGSTAQAQTQGGGGNSGGASGPTSGMGTAEGFRDMTVLAKVPSSQTRRPNDPPRMVRRSGGLGNQCALQHQPVNSMECAPY